MANPQSPRNGGSGWRGSASDEAAEFRHRWQSAEQTGGFEESAEKAPAEGRGRRIAFAVLLLAALVLLGFYVRSLLLAPVQTPVVMLTAGPYPAPFAPNDFAREDADALNDLNDKTLNVAHTSNLKQFYAQIRESLARQKRSQVVVLAISMHGAVNEEGQPCLVPPTSSPARSSTWEPLSNVLAAIRDALRDSGIPDKSHKLLVLDCNRVRTWWPQGTLDNTFADRLAGVVKESGIPNLIALNSTSSGERGWAAPQLRGSVFGHYFRKGIAGAADDDGNSDRSVSLKELFAYLTRHVDRWSRHHYGESQRPMLLSGESGANAADVDFHVAWAVRWELPDPKPPVGAVKAEDIAALWRFHDQSADKATYRLDPLTWSRFQTLLLRLEAANAAGEAYASAATTHLSELRRLRERIEQQRAKLSDGRSLFSDFQTFTEDTEGTLPTAHLPDLELSRWLGRIDPATADRVQAALAAVMQAPTPQAILDAWQTVDLSPQSRILADAQFLRMLLRYRPDALWKKTVLLAAVMKLRRQASQTAVPDDLRAFRSIRDSLAMADARRRIIEDWLLAGEASAPADIDRRATEIALDYSKADDKARSLAAAFRLRDRVHAELPWLLAWLTHQGSGGIADRHVIERLADDLVKDFLKFRQDLRGAEPTTGLAASVENQFQRLRTYFDREGALLARAQNPDAAVLRRIRAVLSVPLAPGSDDRAALTAAAREMAVRIHRAYSPGAPATAGETSAAQSTSLRWRRHPMLSLLADRNGNGGVAKPDRSAERPYEIEAGLRNALAVLHDEISQLASQPNENAPEFRSQSAWAAERWRAGLSLPIPSVERDPVHFLRRFDLQELLVWQAERSLRDFWGNLGSETEPPFYTRAVNRQLDAAKFVFGHFAGFEKTQKNMAARLERWKGLPILQTQAVAGLKIDPSDRLAVSVSLMQRPGASFAGGGENAGIAAVSIWDRTQRVDTAVRSFPVRRKDAGPAGQPHSGRMQFSVDPMHAMSSGGALWANAVYRGHEYPARFEMSVAGGAPAEVRPEHANRASVTVRGSATRPLSIVFILDCSHSMANVVRRDGTGKTRHQVALAALKSMLATLAERRNARVGVVFYGHRVAWNASRPSELLRQTDYARKFPDELLPLEDVEAVLPLGRFDDRVAKNIDRLLSTVKPWGETPLYLAIDEALRQFAGESSDAERRIVVITDGVNNQRVPKDLQLTKSQAAKVTSLSDLGRAIRKQPVPVDILGFEMDSTEERGAQQDFRGIARLSKGSYHAAIDAKSLLSTLRSLLGPAEFEVAGGETTLRAALGKAIPITIPATSGAVNRDVRVGSAGAKVEFQGGEALELVIGRDGASLESARYVQGDPQFVPLVDPQAGVNSGTLVGLHTSRREGTDVEFTVSLQRTDRSFSPRLPLVWIEVTPMTGADSPAGKPYYFLDAAYASQTPVPVLKLRAANWPTTAKLAAIQVWCQRAAVSSQAIALSSLLATAKKPVGKKGSPDANRIAGSLLRADLKSEQTTLVLRVIQRRISETDDLRPLKIDVAGVQPKRIVRQFDVRNGIALHRFEFDAGQEPLLSAANLKITGRDVALRDALRFARAATLSVQAKGEVIRLTVPPLGTRN